MESIQSQNCAVTGINIYKKFSFNKKVNWILNGINITIPKGKITAHTAPTNLIFGINWPSRQKDVYRLCFSLLGESGSGKTTLIRCIIGKTSIDRGELKVMGRNPKTGALIGYMPQSISLSDKLSVKETLWLYGKCTGLRAKNANKRANFLLEMLSMTQHQHSKIKNLSGGEKRRVSFAVALLHEAPLIILDEPTVGVDPVLRHVIWQYLKHVVTFSNSTVILTTHYIDEAIHSDYVSFLHDGQIKACSTPTSLMEKYNCSTLEQVFLQLCQLDYNDQNQLVCDDINLKDSPNYYQNCIQSKKRCCLDTVKTKIEVGKMFRLKHLSSLAKMWQLELLDSPKIAVCLFLLPTILLLLIPLSLNMAPRGAPIAIVNSDLGTLGRGFVDAIDSSMFQKKIYYSYDKAVNDTRLGMVIGCVLIQENFTSSFYKKEDISDNGSSIVVALDNSNLPNSIIVPSNLLLTYQKFAKSVQTEGLTADLPIKFTNNMSQKQDANSTSFVTVGIFISICIILFSSISGISLFVTNETNQFERLNISGVSSSEIVLSFALFQTFLVLPFIALTTTAVFIVNGIHCAGSIFLVMLIIFLQSNCGIYLGLLIASISLNGFWLIFFNGNVFFLTFMFQGVIHPVSTLAKNIQSLCLKGPSFSSIEAIRGILNYGWTITQQTVLTAFLTSGVWISITLTISIIVFRLRE